MKLFHGSYDKITDMTIHAGDLFNGMFFLPQMKRVRVAQGLNRAIITASISQTMILQMSASWRMKKRQLMQLTLYGAMMPTSCSTSSATRCRRGKQTMNRAKL
ncbi:hypothetical protein [uncultured Mitsuokella sp.]|uniref:hypothetical protein n=1 Tax=uncultured Mitsuokella sp. TaxID=453120 RepID=UPI0025DBB718|nr:hypothetical protein [uncultured Mitsuokella sp.]